MSVVYRRLDQVEVVELDGETLVLNPETFAVTKLNEVGGWVWRTMDDCATFEQLEQRMTETFDADRRRMSADLTLFLNEMIGIGLIKIAKDTE
ncbi:PqqD family protein [Cohnella faecalis]|uniref:PqqD family protein n=1 Tax=Cohnella faecalis TaxID=2315694 RepID=UPI001314F194|nr:PqqD family protein [Cohnella faecalis]